MKDGSGFSDRIAYFDYLRVFAAFGVIMIHVASQMWYVTDIRTVEWQIFNVYDSCVRWSVPVFVMISGAVFLGYERDIRTIFSKNILRLATAFFFWGLVYALFSDQNIESIIKNTISGRPHMWFVPMIAGLYISIPIFQKIVESPKVTKYFLTVSFVFIYALPQISAMIKDLRLEMGAFNGIFDAFVGLLSSVKGSLFVEYASYFVAGYYLSRTDFNRKTRKAIYCMGALGFLATIFLGAFYSLRIDAPVSYYYESFTVNVMLESVAVFVWFRYNAQRWKAWDALAYKLSKYSFGAYLVHVLILEQLNLRLGISSLSFNPLLSVPVISLIVSLFSFGISGLLNQIPFLKKYIV